MSIKLWMRKNELLRKIMKLCSTSPPRLSIYQDSLTSFIMPNKPEWSPQIHFSFLYDFYKGSAVSSMCRFSNNVKIPYSHGAGLKIVRVRFQVLFQIAQSDQYKRTLIGFGIRVEVHSVVFEFSYWGISLEVNGLPWVGSCRKNQLNKYSEESLHWRWR